MHPQHIFSLLQHLEMPHPLYTHVWLVRSEKSPTLIYLTQQRLSLPALPSTQQEQIPVIPFTTQKEEYIQDVPTPAQVPGSEKSGYYSVSIIYQMKSLQQDYNSLLCSSLLMLSSSDFQWEIIENICRLLMVTATRLFPS